mmetsp:Transcript_22211/g.50872  ORF Transcript_22211/g.50872 Transcript_22211/m.50872 type:complete len:118 (+) Transcript_22211:273-626(+)
MEDVLCNDDATFRYMNDSNLGCEWVKRNEKICNLQWQNKLVSQFCSDSCNVCDSAETCFDDLNFRFMHIEGKHNLKTLNNQLARINELHAVSIAKLKCRAFLRMGGPRQTRKMHTLR